MTTAGLLDIMPPTDLQVQPQPQSRKSLRPAFAEHLKDADAGIPVLRDKPRSQPRSRVGPSPRDPGIDRKREPAASDATAPTVVVTPAEVPHPLTLELGAGNADGSENAECAIPVNLATGGLSELQPDAQQMLTELLPGDLAFAAKVGSAGPAKDSPGVEAPQFSAATDQKVSLIDQMDSASAGKPSGGSAGEQQPEHETGTPKSQTPATSLHSVLESIASPSAAGPQTPLPAGKSDSVDSAQAVQLSPIDHQPQKAVTPLRDIQVQVGGGSQERVDVRLVDKSGELHVAVRAGSDNLTRDLRQGLSDLVGKLESNGYRTEVWRPGTVSAAPATAETTSSNDGHDRESQAHPGWYQDGGKREQQDQQKPRWVEELEFNTPGGDQKSPGGWHGLTR